LGRIFAGFLKEELGSLHADIGRIEHCLGATEARIDGLQQRVDGLEQRMDDFAVSLEEQIRDFQTEILKVMLTIRESNLARFTDLETLRERVSILERCLLDIRLRLARFADGVLPRHAPARLQ